MQGLVYKLANKYMYYFYFFVTILLSSNYAFSQLTHQTLSAQSSEDNVDNIYVFSLVSQNSPIGVFELNDKSYYQGFIHPTFFLIENLEETVRDSGLSVYPNPFSTTLNLSFNDVQQFVNISFIDISGRMIFSKYFEPTDKIVQISIPQYMPTIAYSVLIETANQKHNLKLIKHAF